MFQATKPDEDVIAQVICIEEEVLYLQVHGSHEYVEFPKDCLAEPQPLSVGEEISYVHQFLMQSILVLIVMRELLVTMRPC